MASINVSEADFEAVAGAAHHALRAGRVHDAEALDKIARKINAALTIANRPTTLGMPLRTLRWQEMPSTLDPLNDG